MLIYNQKSRPKTINKPIKLKISHIHALVHDTKQCQYAETKQIFPFPDLVIFHTIYNKIATKNWQILYQTRDGNVLQLARVDNA